MSKKIVFRITAMALTIVNIAEVLTQAVAIPVLWLITVLVAFTVGPITSEIA